MKIKFTKMQAYGNDYVYIDAIHQSLPDLNKLQVRTAHSLNQVPFIIYDKNTRYEIKEGAYGLANVAPTIATIFGLTAPESWEKSMI